MNEVEIDECEAREEKADAEKKQILDEPLRFYTADVAESTYTLTYARKIHGLAKRIAPTYYMRPCSYFGKMMEHATSCWRLDGKKVRVQYCSTSEAYFLFSGTVKIQTDTDTGEMATYYARCILGEPDAEHVHPCCDYTPGCSCQSVLQKEYEKQVEERWVWGFAKMPVPDNSERETKERTLPGDVDVFCVFVNLENEIQRL